MHVSRSWMVLGDMNLFLLTIWWWARASFPGVVFAVGCFWMPKHVWV